MKPRTITVWICLIGLVLRVMYILLFNRMLIYPDEERFWRETMSLIANGILQSGGKFAHDMPLTAMSMAAVIKLTGCGVVGIKVFFAIISSLTIYFIGRLAYHISSSEKAAIFAMSIAAVYPFFIYYSSLVLSETLFIFLLVLTFLSLFRCADWKCNVTGFLMGVTHLTRPTLFYFFPIFWGWLIFFRKVKLRYVFGSIFVFVVVILPWGVRNHYTIGKFLVSTSGSGQVLWEGNNPWNVEGGVSGDFSDPQAYLQEMPEELDELEQDNWKKTRAIKFIKENPERFFVISLKRFVRFWNLWPNTDLFSDWEYKILSLGSFGLVLLLALISPFFLWQERKQLGLLVVFVSYYTAIHMVTLGSIRYRLPLEPFLIAIAGATLAKIFSKLNRF